MLARGQNGKPKVQFCLNLPTCGPEMKKQWSIIHNAQEARVNSTSKSKGPFLNFQHGHTGPIWKSKGRSFEMPTCPYGPNLKKQRSIFLNYQCARTSPK